MKQDHSIKTLVVGILQSVTRYGAMCSSAVNNNSVFNNGGVI